MRRYKVSKSSYLEACKKYIPRLAKLIVTYLSAPFAPSRNQESFMRPGQSERNDLNTSSTIPEQGQGQGRHDVGQANVRQLQSQTKLQVYVKAPKNDVPTNPPIQYQIQSKSHSIQDQRPIKPSAHIHANPILLLGTLKKKRKKRTIASSTDTRTKKIHLLLFTNI